MVASFELEITTTSLDPLTLDPPLPPETRQRLLRFSLGSEDSALLPLEQIAEILRINVAEILSVPKMPSCVLGICNWQGEMLWLVDINHLVGYPPIDWTVVVSPMVIVIQLNQQSVGLVVQQVKDIELHELSQLQRAETGLFPPKLLPFILGALPGDDGVVLDVTAITQYPLWQLHQVRNS